MNAFQGTGRAAPGWTRAAGAPAQARLKSAGRQRGGGSDPGMGAPAAHFATRALLFPSAPSARARSEVPTSL